MEGIEPPSTSSPPAAAASPSKASITSPAQTQPAPQASPSISTEAHVEAVLSGMNRFAALSRAFVKPTNTSANAASTSPSSTTACRESPAGRSGGGGASTAGGGIVGSGMSASASTPILSSSSDSKMAPALAAGTSLMDRILPALTATSASASSSPTAEVLATGTAAVSPSLGCRHASPTQKSVGGSSSLSNTSGNEMSTDAAAVTSSFSSSPPSNTGTLAPGSKLYRPPHARDDTSRVVQQQQPQSASSSQVQHALPAAAAAVSGSQPATSPASKPTVSPAAAARMTAPWSSSSKNLAPGSTLSTPTTVTTTMASRLREGTAIADSGTTLLPPSVDEVHTAGNSDAMNVAGSSNSSDNSSNDNYPQPRPQWDASVHSNHSLSHAEANDLHTNGSNSTTGNSGGVSYLAVARRTGGGQGGHASERPSSVSSPPLAPNSAPAVTVSAGPSSSLGKRKSDASAISLSPPRSSESKTADMTNKTIATKASLETLAAEEILMPVVQSRSAKRKRKLRAMKAAATAAALVEAQASGKPLPTTTTTTKTTIKHAVASPEVSQDAENLSSTPAVAATAPAANTCGVSRRPGWHPSLSVASAMLNGETIAKLAASQAAAAAAATGYASFNSPRTGFFSHTTNSQNASPAMMNYAGALYMNPTMPNTIANMTTAITTTSNSANSRCGSARYEPVDANTRFMQHQQQPQQQLHNHHQYHNYNMYPQPPQQQQQVDYNAMRDSTSPDQQQLIPIIESVGHNSHGGSDGPTIGSGAAGTMLDPNSVTMAAPQATGVQRPSPNAATATTTMRGGGVLRRGRGGTALHTQSSQTAATVAGSENGPPTKSSGQQQLPPRVASPSSMTMLLPNGPLPTIRVSAAGTLVSAPLPVAPHTGSGKRSSVASNTSPRKDSGSGNANTNSNTTNTSITATNSPSGNAAIVKSPTSAPSSAGASRSHHHQHHDPLTFAAAAVNTLHGRTPSYYSGNGGPAATTTSEGSRVGDLTTEEVNATQNLSEYGGHTAQRPYSQQQEPPQELQYTSGDWSQTSSHNTNANWSGPPNAKTKTTGSCGNLNRANSRGRNSNSGNVNRQVSLNHNRNSSNALQQMNGSGGGGMNTYNSNYRNVKSGSTGMVQGGLYGGSHHHPQQQHHYMSPVLYADPKDDGAMKTKSANVTGHGKSTGPNNNTTNVHHNNGNDSLQGPMPYYDFITVLPTFVAACLTLRPEDEAAREQLCWTIEAVLRCSLTKNAEIRVHGSITTGLALPSSDVDVLVVDYQPIAPLDALQMLSKALIELDDASLKDALEFQESVEKEKHRERLAEQQRQQYADAGVTTTTTAITTAAEAAVSPNAVSPASQSFASPGNDAQPHEQPSHCSNSVSQSSPDLPNEESNAAKVDKTEEISALSTNASPNVSEHAKDKTEASSIVASVIAVTTTASSCGGGAVEQTDAAPLRPSSYPLDGRKAFLTAASTLLQVDEDDAFVHYSATTKMKERKEDEKGAEETEVYGTVDDVEQAEEVFRDQIEKDYSFSTTLDLSTLFAPVMGGGGGGACSGAGVAGGGSGGAAPKASSISSPLTGQMALPPSLFSTHAAAARGRTNAASTAMATTETAGSGLHSSYSSTSTSMSGHSSFMSSSATSSSASSSVFDVTVTVAENGHHTMSRSAQEEEGKEEVREGPLPQQQPRGDTDAGTSKEEMVAQPGEGSADNKKDVTAERETTESATKTAVAAATATATAATTSASPSTSATVGSSKQVQRNPSPTKKGMQSATTMMMEPSPGGRPGSHLTYVPVYDGHFFYVQAITATRVPVIKLTDKATGTKVDITFAGGEHWRSMQLTRSLLDVFPQARPLILFLKFCVRSLGVGESEPGGVTSFTIYLMVLHFYNECRKRVISILQEREAASNASSPSTANGMNSNTNSNFQRNTENGTNSPHAYGAHVGEDGVPLPRLSAEEEQQPSVRGGSAPANVTAAQQPTTSTATTTASPPLDLGLLENFLGEYLTRVEQRHAQLLESKAAESAAAAAAATTTTTNRNTDGTAVHVNAASEQKGHEDSHEQPVAPSSSFPVQNTNERGGRNSRNTSNSVGACATIRAAYNNADKAHLKTIREVILGFVGKPDAEVTGVVPSLSSTLAHEDEPEGQQQQVSSPRLQRHSSASSTGAARGLGGGIAVALSGNSSPMPQGAATTTTSASAAVAVNGGGGAMKENDRINYADGATESRGRHVPPPHHYLMKTVEPQPHERGPVTVDATASKEAEGGGGKATEVVGVRGGMATAATCAAEGLQGEVAEGETEDAAIQHDTAITVAGLFEHHTAENVEGGSAQAVRHGDVDDTVDTTHVGENTSHEHGSQAPSSADHKFNGSEEAAAVAVSSPPLQELNEDAPATETDEAARSPQPPRDSTEESPPLSSPKQTSAEAYEKFAEDFLQRQVNVSDLFLDFCHYYGCTFDYETCGIRFSVDGRSEVVEKPYLCSRRGQHFHLTSPFDPEYDLTARMTHMRDFQWLCWWFTEWGAARQTPMYYGGCSLQYVLQCLSPHTAEADCQAVHRALMEHASAAAQRRRETAGSINGFLSPMLHSVQQQPQQQYLSQQQGLDRNAEVMPSMAQQQQQQAFYGSQQHQQLNMMGMNNGQDLNMKGVHLQQQQEQYAAMPAYGQVMMVDPQFQPQQQQYSMLPADAHVGNGVDAINTNNNGPSTEMAGEQTGFHIDSRRHQHQNQHSHNHHHNSAGPGFIDRLDSSHHTIESVLTDGNPNARHRRPPPPSMQLPCVDSQETLEGYGTHSTSVATPVTTENKQRAATEEENVGGEIEALDEEDEVATFQIVNSSAATTTTAGSTHEEEEQMLTAGTQREEALSGEDAAKQTESDRRHNHDSRSSHPAQDHEEVIDAAVSVDQVTATTTTTALYHGDGAQGNAPVPIYWNRYPQQNVQRGYRRPYGHEVPYYDLQQQQQQQQQQIQRQPSQQAAEAAAFYYQAYANANSAYTPQQQPPPQQQQQPCEMAAAPNFYPFPQTMLYPSPHVMYQQQQQQQHAAAIASSSANYAFPLLHYDVQQYLWMQEQQQQQQRQQQQQQQHIAAARRPVSREQQDAETSSASDITAPSPSSPATVPAASASTTASQQQQPQNYYSAYAMCPAVYNEAMWNRAAATGGDGSSGGREGHPSIQTMGPYPRSVNPSVNYAERSGTGSAGAGMNMMPHPQKQQPQQHQGGRGGHPRSAPRRQVSVPDMYGASAPQQQQQHAPHSRQSSKVQNTSSLPEHDNEAGGVDVQFSGPHGQPPQTENAEETSGARRSQNGSPLLSPTTVSQSRT